MYRKETGNSKGARAAEQVGSGREEGPGTGSFVAPRKDLGFYFKGEEFEGSEQRRAVI